MKAAGVKARHKRRRTPAQLEAAAHSIAPNLLDRKFEASAPNPKWTADFTYIWIGEGWLFVAIVLDLYSRRVVGWSMQTTMTAQYTSEDFQRLLESHGIVRSMSRRGNCWDNAAMESFFSRFTFCCIRLSKGSTIHDADTQQSAISARSNLKI